MFFFADVTNSKPQWSVKVLCPDQELSSWTAASLGDDVDLTPEFQKLLIRCSLVFLLSC